MEAEAQAIRPNLRIVLKLSGEILSNVDGYGIDRDALTRLADEINALHQANAEVALVIGGGNIIRGETFSASGAARTTADYMGMLVTVVNALALQDALESQATKVDGVYSDNPDLNPDAKLYKKLSYDEALSQNLAVMDTTAIVLCKEHKIPIRVFNMKTRGACENIIKGSDIGTLISI